jgi:hypothetical protein
MARTKKKKATISSPHWTETTNYLNADGFQDRVRSRNARYFPELFPGVTPSDVPLFPDLEEERLQEEEEAWVDELAAMARHIRDHYTGEDYGILVNALILLWPTVEDGVLDPEILAHSLDVAMGDPEVTVGFIKNLMGTLKSRVEEFDHPPLAALDVATDWNDYFIHDTSHDGEDYAISDRGMLYILKENEWRPFGLVATFSDPWIVELAQKVSERGPS